MISWSARANNLPDPRAANVPQIFLDQREFGPQLKPNEVRLFRALLGGAFAEPTARLAAFDDALTQFRSYSPGEILDLLLTTTGYTDQVDPGEQSVFSRNTLFEFRATILQVLKLDFSGQDLHTIYNLILALRRFSAHSAEITGTESPTQLIHTRLSRLRTVTERLRSSRVELLSEIERITPEQRAQFDRAIRAHVSLDTFQLPVESLQQIHSQLRILREQLNAASNANGINAEAFARNPLPGNIPGIAQNELEAILSKYQTRIEARAESLPAHRAEIFLREVRSAFASLRRSPDVQTILLEQLEAGQNDWLNQPAPEIIQAWLQATQQGANLWQIGRAFTDRLAGISITGFQPTISAVAINENRIGFQTELMVPRELIDSAQVLRALRGFISLGALADIHSLSALSPTVNPESLMEKLRELWQIRAFLQLADLEDISIANFPENSLLQEDLKSFRADLQSWLLGRDQELAASLLAIVQSMRSQISGNGAATQAARLSNSALSSGLLSPFATLQEKIRQAVRERDFLADREAIIQQLTEGLESLDLPLPAPERIAQFRFSLQATSAELREALNVREGLKFDSLQRLWLEAGGSEAWRDLAETQLPQRLLLAFETVVEKVLAEGGPNIEREWKNRVMLQVEAAAQQGINEIRAFMAKLGNSSEFQASDPVVQNFVRFVVGRYFQILQNRFFVPILSSLVTSERLTGQTLVAAVVKFSGPHFQKFLQLQVRSSASPYLASIMRIVENDLPATEWEILDSHWRRAMPGFYPERFRAITREPIGVGVLAETHWAIVSDEMGRDRNFAMRTLKPGIDAAVSEDERVFTKIAREIEADPNFAGTALLAIRDFTETQFLQVREEMDFLHTINSQEAGADALESTAYIRHGRNRYRIDLRVPRTAFPEFAPSGVMFMDLVERGQKLDRIFQNTPTLLRGVLGFAARRLAGEAFFGSGFIHGDPHLGNWLARFNPADEFHIELYLLDFGLTGRLSREEQRALLTTSIAMRAGNLDETARLSETLGRSRPESPPRLETVQEAFFRAQRANDSPSVDYLLNTLAAGRFEISSGIQRFNRTGYTLETLLTYAGADFSLGSLLGASLRDALYSDLPGRIRALPRQGLHGLPSAGIPLSNAELARAIYCELKALGSR